MTNLDWVPEACALPTAEQPLRVAEFDDLFTAGLRDFERSSATQLSLKLDPAVEAQARDLTERETSCCSFFSFTFAASVGELQLDISVRETHADVLDGLEARLSR